MKKMKILNTIAIMAIVFMGYACSDDDETVDLNNAKVTLSYPEGTDVKEGVPVKARANGPGGEYELKTDNTGSVVFQLPMGNYEFTASDSRIDGNNLTTYNGLSGEIIDDTWDETAVLTLKMEGSTRSQLIIKEIYFGGCPSDDGTDSYNQGEYIVLYNNSIKNVDLKNLCIGAVGTNSDAMTMLEIQGGDTEAYWFKEDWTPAAYGYFYFPNSTILEPGKELVVAISGGIDHTKTHSKSVDLSKSEYYVCYDIEEFDHELTYPAPSANIDASHYLEGVNYGIAESPVIPSYSPNIFLFYPEGQSPEAYGKDRTNDDYWLEDTMFPRKKVPADWTVDAIDVFDSGYPDKNKKRLNPKIDAGYVYLVGKKGFTLYRNVDKEATEAIEGNKEKLVYGYSMGTDKEMSIDSDFRSTDPSEIDAEASITNGAQIIFKDTNNSGNDFHLRRESSLRK